jgi:hypothetical protein
MESRSGPGELSWSIPLCGKAHCRRYPHLPKPTGAADIKAEGTEPRDTGIRESYFFCPWCNGLEILPTIEASAKISLSLFPSRLFLFPSLLRGGHQPLAWSEKTILCFRDQIRLLLSGGWAAIESYRQSRGPLGFAQAQATASPRSGNRLDLFESPARRGPCLPSPLSDQAIFRVRSAQAQPQLH